MIRLGFLSSPKLTGDFIALAAGLLMPLAFAPFGLPLLGVMAPALVLLTWLEVSSQRALLRGLLFGMGYFGFGFYWLYTALHEYGHASVAVSALMLMLLITLMALYPALQGYLITRLFPNNTPQKYLLAFPASWVLAEWLRSTLFTGFPWLLLGDSQLHTPLRGLAPLFGTYGVALAVTLTSGILVACLRCSLRTQLKSLAVLLLLWGSAIGFSAYPFTKLEEKSLLVSLIQADVPQDKKWDPEHIDAVLAHYTATTLQQQQSDLVIWPEAAITIDQRQAKFFLAKISEQARHKQQALIVGLPIFESNHYYNSLVVLGDGSGEYRKRHLVPFGEYLPLRFIFEAFSSWVTIPMSDFVAGEILPPLRIKGITIAAFICYEIAFPELVRKSAKNTNLLITLADDSWFGHSIALPQHLQLAQMRALENGRYHLLATNNGITAIINPLGVIVHEIPPFTQDVLVGVAYSATGKTPWQSWGMWPVGLLIGLFLLGAWRKRQ